MEEPEEALEYLKRCAGYAMRCRETVSIADFKKIGLDRLLSEDCCAPLRERPEFQAVLAALEPEK